MDTPETTTHPTDTIAALATARGASALAVIRVSGSDAVSLVASRFTDPGFSDAPGNTLHVGWMTDGSGARLDQVVCSVFRAPRSATGEDTVEISTHGGDAAPQAVLRCIFDAGARPADAGEFTQRAFLNGKLDLAQAEAVADLIHAESRLGQRAAVAQLQGRVSDAVNDIREALISTAALVELELDFSEEDVEFADRSALRDHLKTADARLAELLDTAKLGAMVRDGVSVAIGGRPNAGKSTLLNALTGRDRAIVSATPGTTRDAIEADAEIDGLRVRFTDTAGLRDTEDEIEAEGTRRARAALECADAVLYVYDASMGLDTEELTHLVDLRKFAGRPLLLVANKSDLPGAAPTKHAISLSARASLVDPASLDGLREALMSAVRAELTSSASSEIAVNERHRTHLAAAREAVSRAIAALERGDGDDTLAMDLRAALHELGLVVGAVTSEDVLSAVFSRFCIGK